MSNKDKNMEEPRGPLRKKFEYNTPDEDGWNMPSDKVWTGLSNELSASRNASRRKIRNYILVLSAFVITALMLLRECSNRNRIQNLQKELQQTKESFEKLQKDCDEKSSSYRNNDRKDTETLLAAAPLSPALKIQSPVNHSFINKKHPKNVVAVDTHHADEQLVFPVTLLTQKKGNDILLQSTTVAAVGETPISAIQTIERLATLQVSPVHFDTPPQIRFTNPKENRKHLPLILYGLGGISNTGNRLTGTLPDIITRQKALTGWQTGIGIEAGIGRRWSLLTGLHYSQHRLQTDYALAVPFTHIGEYMHNDGNYDNQYQHSLPSSLGDYSLQLLLSRESTATIDEGEIIRLDLNVRQNIQQLGLPLGIRYALGQKRWQTGISAGVVARHTLSAAAEDEPLLVSHHGAIHQRQTTVGNPSTSDMRAFTLDASLGLDFRYRLMPQLGISIGANWQKAFTPVYKDENVQSYLQSFGIHAGLHFWVK